MRIKTLNDVESFQPLFSYKYKNSRNHDKILSFSHYKVNTRSRVTLNEQISLKPMEKKSFRSLEVTDSSIILSQFIRKLPAQEREWVRGVS